MAKGKTLKEALGKLKDRREAAIVQLEALKADKESIEVGAPSLSKAQEAQKKQFEMMVMQRMSARGKKVPKGLQAPKSVTVSAKLKAQWPLEADSPEEFLLAVESLKKEIKDADITGSKEAEKLSAEEEELAEEMEAMMRNSGEGKVPVGEPAFVYVARISDEEHNAAMAEAFTKAKEQATRLAAAAGIELGPLVGLSGQGSGSNSFGNGMGYRRQQYLQQLIGVGGMSEMGSNPNEAISTSAGPIKFQFMVNASFGFKAP